MSLASQRITAVPFFMTQISAATHLCIEGSGPPLLLVHGGPGLSADCLRPVVDLLRDHYRVILYDQPRKHHFLGTTTGSCIQAFVEQIEGIRLNVGEERFVLLGHSWGAGLAALYAEAFQDRVAALILAHPMEISSVYLASTTRSLEMRRPEKDRRRMRGIENELSSLPFHDFRRNELELEQMMMDFRLSCADAPAGHVLESLNLCYYDWEMSERVWRDLENQWPSLVRKGYDLCPVFSRIATPAQILMGEHDTIDSRSTIQMAQLLNAQLVRLNKSGHWSFLEQPEEFKNVLNAFLEPFKDNDTPHWKLPSQHRVPLKAVAAGVI